VTLPDGRTVRLGGIEPGPAAAMTLYDYGFASRLLRGGDIGIAEAYLRGEWDTPDLTQFLYLFCVNHDWMQTMLGDKPLMRFVQIVRHWFNRNTKRQARRNIYAHYDIGNAFYSAWLDPSMTYSSALFEDHTPDLTAAQTTNTAGSPKRSICSPARSLLEIGCGWGGFAEYAAKTYGAKVVGLTISKEQRDFAQARIQNAGPRRQGRDPAAGLSRRARPVRPDRLDRDDRGGRRAVLAEIFFTAARPAAARRPRRHSGHHHSGQPVPDLSPRSRFHPALRFSRRHAALAAGLKSLGERFGVPVIRERIFGQDYAKTLATWRNNFRAAWPNLMPLGFDDRFRRLWEYYLAYCEAGFLSGNIDVHDHQQRRRRSDRQHAADQAQARSEATGCTILGKAEFMNPGQSVKDRAGKDDPRGREARRAQARRPRGRRHRRQHRHRLASSPTRAATAR
jgi:cyclopropane-fatty-acyl-phospholipid synthase